RALRQVGARHQRVPRRRQRAPIHRRGARMTALIILIALALLFDVANGFHDAANSIATIVSTKVLSPKLAVLWAAFFNFVAFLVFRTHVASSIASGVHQQDLTLPLLRA